MCNAKHFKVCWNQVARLSCQGISPEVPYKQSGTETVPPLMQASLEEAISLQPIFFSFLDTSDSDDWSSLV